ncbi:MAG: hypothetical protein FWC27_03395, partial [Firmicutes bacterium]|nr:hypothetical protein [Bacillota bacterium]
GVYVTAGTVAGNFTMNGGTISNNYAGHDSFGTGGGVYILGNSTFTMNNGTISDNIASRTDYGNGGGVRVGSSGSFTMKGGVITRNTASLAAGTGTGGGVNLVGKSTFTMSDTAEISYNTGSVNGGGNGGGVYVEDSTFTLKGTMAAIRNNAASKNGKGFGGGIYLTSSAKFYAQNTVQITGNTARAGDGGGIFSEDHPYSTLSDTISAAKYSPIQEIGANVVFSGNKAGARYSPPKTVTGTPIRFPTILLNNDDVNYHGLSGPLPPISLTITKTVKGGYGDKTMEFTFQVFMGRSDTAGEIHKLKDGQSFTLDDIASGTEIRILELDHGGYRVSFKDGLTPPADPAQDGDDTGWLTMTAPRSVTFFNLRDMAPETGIRLGDTGAALLLCLLPAGAALGFLAAGRIRRRRRGGA